MYELCRAHGLPLPHVNCSIEGRVRDCFWPECRLVVTKRPDYVVGAILAALCYELMPPSGKKSY